MRRMRLKLWLRYPVDIRRARRLLAGKAEWTSAPLQPPVVLDLRTPGLMFDCGRHFQSIAFYAFQAASPTLVRCSHLLLGGIARKTFGRTMLAQSHVHHLRIEHELPAGSLVLGDYDPSGTESRRFGEIGATYYRMLIGREIDRSIPVMPYPMHPATLGHLSNTDLNALREPSTSRRAILFAGCQEARYGDSWMQREFGILSRLEVLETLRQRFPGRIGSSLDPPGSPPSPDSSNSIVLVDSRVQGISAACWLPTLARARFFLCCPGGRQPLCHNLIEAMSVGTIPIIEYGDRITPQLIDGETAICFRGRAGLVEAVERIAGMSEAELHQFSRRVAAFYDEYLCGIRFLRRLRDGELDGASGRLCMPFHERNLYDSAASRAA